MPKSNKDTELDKILTDFYWAVENDIGGEPKFAPEPVKQAKQAIQDLIDKEVRKAEQQAYKSGYAQGGIDQIIAHDKATQDLIVELQTKQKGEE